jgi:hypothetical protein
MKEDYTGPEYGPDPSPYATPLTDADGDAWFPVILTFLDEDGAEWTSAAQMYSLHKSGSNDSLKPDRLVDRAFRLRAFRVVNP